VQKLRAQCNFESIGLDTKILSQGKAVG